MPKKITRIQYGFNTQNLARHSKELFRIVEYFLEYEKQLTFYDVTYNNQSERIKLFKDARRVIEKLKSGIG